MAPLREVTIPISSHKRLTKISIHASLREATLFPVIVCKHFIQFQSTPPCGRRRYNAKIETCTMPISIHASLREATNDNAPTSIKSPNFNPRLPAGGDDRFMWRYKIDILFQSTPPCGRRHGEIRRTGFALYFNPRLPAGGDLSASILYLYSS